jgi:type II secretory pathway pseudopilin PulG
MMKKIRNFKFVIRNRNAGMSYVELIVVLSIFAMMSSLVIFNYGNFQANVDVRNLASDIALQIVTAQKSAMSGQLPPLAQQALIVSPSTWKPSYGVYFNLFPAYSSYADSKSFVYFVDVYPDGYLNPGSINCPPNDECLNKISITKGNTISSVDVFYVGDATPHYLGNLAVTFVRPNSGAIIKSGTPMSPTSTINYVQITVVSPKGQTALIKIYASGRVQVN